MQTGVWYTLPSKDGPVEPGKLWRGWVLHVFEQTSSHVPCLWVESCEEGFSGLSEIIYPEQVQATEGDVDPILCCECSERLAVPYECYCQACIDKMAEEYRQVIGALLYPHLF